MSGLCTEYYSAYDEYGTYRQYGVLRRTPCYLPDPDQETRVLRRSCDAAEMTANKDGWTTNGWNHMHYCSIEEKKNGLKCQIRY